VGDIDLKVISAAENSNKFPKNQVGLYTWWPLADKHMPNTARTLK